MEGSDLYHAPTLGKNPGTDFNRRLVGPQRRAERFGNDKI